MNSKDDAIKPTETKNELDIKLELDAARALGYEPIVRDWIVHINKKNEGWRKFAPLTDGGHVIWLICDLDIEYDNSSGIPRVMNGVNVINLKEVSPYNRKRSAFRRAVVEMAALIYQRRS